MSKSIKALVLAGALLLAATSAVQAGGKVTGGDFHASAAPVCDATVRSQRTAHDGRLFGRQCPLLAGGRVTGSEFHANASAACDTDKCPVLAGDGGPSSAGDNNGRAELVIDSHSRMAGGRGAISGDFHAELSTHRMLAGGRTGIGGEVRLQLDTHRMFAGGR